MSQPAFTDLSGHLTSLSYGSGPQDEWRALDGVMRGIGETAREMTYVHNARVYEFAQLLEQIAPPRKLIGVFGFTVLLYGACIFWVGWASFVDLPKNEKVAEKIETGQVGAGLAGILLFGVFWNAMTFYSIGAWLEDVEASSIPMLLVGGFFLTLFVLVSFAFALPVIERAFIVLRRSAHAQTQFAIGSRYEAGRDVVQDDAEAAKWYRRAARRGNAQAQFRLGQFYRQGKGVTQDDATALDWLRRAAEQGDAAAQNTLGVLYATGKSVAQDYAEAMNWFVKAAHQGLAAALENVGLLFEKGQGVARNVESAKQWYERAVACGSEVAKARLERLK